MVYRYQGRALCLDHFHLESKRDPDPVYTRENNAVCVVCAAHTCEVCGKKGHAEVDCGNEGWDDNAMTPRGGY